MILLCAVNMIETDEAMEASMRGLEFHVQCVNSGYADELHPPPYPSLNLSETNSAQPLWTALGWQPRPKSNQFEFKKKKKANQKVLRECFGSWRVQTGLG